jgi:hypothetical protein
VDCSSNNVLSCRPAQEDVKNCGACDKRCLDSGACSDGQCDAELERVRLIGGAAPYPHRASLAMADSGELFAAVEGEGEHLALPGGKASLWSGDNAIVKLDSRLDVSWSVVTSHPAQLVAAGADVWLVMSTMDSSVSIGDVTLELATGQVHAVAVKLSGADGHLLESHVFNTDSTSNGPRLVVTGDGAFLAMNLGSSIEYLGTSSQPPEPYHYAALFRLGKASPRWVPGELLSLSADDYGKLVVGVIAPGGLFPFSFGGESFKSGLRWGNIAAARYNTNLGHEASFLMQDSEPATALGVFPSGKDLLFFGGAISIAELRDFAGVRFGSVGIGAYDFAPNLLTSSHGRLLSAGYSPEKPRSLLGRNFDAEVGFVHAFSGKSGELEIAFSVPNEGMHMGVTGVALDATGRSLAIAFGFNGAFELSGRTYGLPSTRGLALMRLKLPPPT